MGKGGISRRRRADMERQSENEIGLYSRSTKKWTVTAGSPSAASIGGSTIYPIDFRGI